jgi:hypothetical protein
VTPAGLPRREIALAYTAPAMQARLFEVLIQSGPILEGAVAVITTPFVPVFVVGDRHDVLTSNTYSWVGGGKKERRLMRCRTASYACSLRPPPTRMFMLLDVLHVMHAVWLESASQISAIH